MVAAPAAMRRARREVDPELTVRRALDDAVRAQEDLLTNLGDREAGHHDLHLPGDLGGRRRGSAAGGDERVDLAAAAVVHDQVVAGRAEIDGHGQAHGAKADVSEFHRWGLPANSAARPGCHAASAADAVRARGAHAAGIRLAPP